jgi:hypothetical protein
VLQLTADLGLLHEAALPLGVVVAVALQHLDGQLAVQLRVAGAQHRAHAAVADLLAELVAPGGGGQRRGGRGVVALRRGPVARRRHVGRRRGADRRGHLAGRGQAGQERLPAPREALQVLADAEVRLAPHAQAVLGRDQLKDGALVVGQLGEAAQVVLDPLRLAGLQPVLQVDVGQLHRGAAAPLPRRRQEGGEVRLRRRLRPGVLEALDDPGQLGRGGGLRRRVLRRAHAGRPRVSGRETPV